MPGLIDWLGKRVKDAENFVGGAVNNVSHFVGDVANNVNRAVAPRPQAPQQRPTVQQPQQPQQGGIARPNGTGGLFTQPSAPSIQQPVQTVQQPTVQNGLNANVNLSQNKIQTQPAPIDGLTKLFGDTIHTAQNAVGDVVNNGAKIVNGIGNGVNTAVNVEKNVAGNVANTVVNNAPKLLNQSVKNGQNLARGVVAAPKAFVDTTNNLFVKPAVDIGTKALSTVETPITGLVGTGMAAADKMFNGGKNYQNILNATKAQMDQNLSTSFVPTDVAAGKASPIKFGTSFAQTGGEVAPYVVAPGAGALTEKLAGTVLEKTGSNLLSKGAHIGANAAISAPTFAALDAAIQGINAVANGGKTGFDPMQSTIAGLQASAMTAGGEAAGMLARGVLKGGVKAADTTQSAIMQRAHDNLVQTDPTYAQQATLAQTMAKNIKAASDAGATPQEIAPHLQNLSSLTQQMQGRMNRQLEGGFAKVPGGSDNVKPPIEAYSNHADPFESNFVNEQVAAHSSPEQYRQQMIDKIWSDNKKGKGVDTWYTYDHPDGQGGGTHINGRGGMSNNSLFYQEFYKQNGYKPTKKAITELVDKELNGEPTILSEQGEIAPNHIESSIYRGLQERKAANESRVGPQSAKTSELAAKAGQNVAGKQQKATSEEILGALGASKDDIKKITSSRNDQKSPQLQQQQSMPKSLGQRFEYHNFSQERQGSKNQLQSPSKSKTSVLADHLAQQSEVYSPNSQNVSKASYSDNTTSQQKASWDNTNSQNELKNNAVSTGKSAKTSDLVKAVEKSEKITKAAEKAMQDGKEIHFYAKKDTNGRSVGIERMNPKLHSIESGYVVDKAGNVVGNHIKVDNTGISVDVGGKPVNMSSIIGDPLAWKDNYRVSDTMSRNIDRMAPGKKPRGVSSEVAQKTKAFLITHKYKAEAKYRNELQTEYKNLNGRIKSVMNAKPRGVSKNAYKEDIFAALNGDTKLSDLKNKYNSSTYNAIKQYHDQTRALYDSLLDRVNEERVKFGQAPIEKRQNYITHLQEMSGKSGFVGDVYQSLKNSFTDDGMQRTRNSVPGDIAGRTENFKPTSAYNKFLQRRTGKESLRDPFNAVQEYLEPALYNIHMTESGVRARAVEEAFRTAQTIRNMQPEQFTSGMNKLVSEYKRTGSNNSRLTTAFQEFANSLDKKTQRWDRQIIDASSTTATAMKGWQGLQRIGGRGTILGNLSSVMMQPLNQVITLADGGVSNYMKGIASAVSGSKAIEKSAFISARLAKDNKPIRGVGEKVMDAGGVPLQAVESAAVKQTWYTMYAKAKSKGLTGQKAIDRADLDTERLVAGRGIADKPELYRSSAANGVLQYTLEVNAQYKALVHDLNAKQLATFLVASAGVNALYNNINGLSPLPDFLSPIIDTAKSYGDKNDKRSALDKTVAGVKSEMGEAVATNPITSALANGLLSQDQRKSLFGTDSSLARFEGTAAPIQVVKNAATGANKLLHGNMAGLQDLAKDVPFGNQIQKTVRGIAVNNNPNDSSHKRSTLIDKAENVLFGPQLNQSTKNYFSQLDKAKAGLSTREQQAIDTYNGIKKDTTTGQYETDKTVYDNEVKSAALLQNPKAIDRLMAMNQSLKKSGSKVDPLWLQSKDNIIKYLQYQRMDPGGANKQDWMNKNSSWYTNVAKQRSDFFNSLPKGDPNKPQNPIKYPTPSKQTETDISTYNSLPQDQKNNFLEDHPNIVDQWNKQADYTNQLRTAQGYAPLKKYPTADEQTQSFMKQYNAADKATRKNLRNNNPDMYKSMIGYYDAVSQYNINKQGALSVLEGEPDTTSKQLKAIKNLSGDVTQNPDGSYSVKPAAWMDSNSGKSNGNRTKSYRPKSSTRRVARGGGRRSGSGTSSKTSTSKLVSIYKASLNTKTPTVKSFKPGGTSAVSTPKLATVKLAKTVKKRSVKTSTLAKNVTITKKKGVVYKV